MERDEGIKAPYLERAGKLQNGFLAAFGALERHHGKGRQTIRIDRINQAVIAPEGGGAGRK